jgi:hypothetical protein
MKFVLAIFFVIVGLASVNQTKGDVIILEYGDIHVGTLVETNEDGIVFIQNGVKVTWPAKQVLESWKTSSEKTTNRIPNWVTIISQLTTNEWAHEFKQIPATVVTDGILKDVPYISFRCNTAGYEINIYGDLDNPAGFEIGAISYNVKNSQAKSNCVGFISSVLTQAKDKDVVTSLRWTPKITKQLEGMTFEITLPDEPDAYGGWWISVYSETNLNLARASGKELLAITQPKVKPAYVPSAYNWSQSDISNYSRQPTNNLPSDGQVYVRGYYRKNGTYVQGYYRHSR